MRREFRSHHGRDIRRYEDTFDRMETAPNRWWNTCRGLTQSLDEKEGGLMQKHTRSAPEWRSVPESHYEVSSHGEVRNSRTGTTLKPWVGHKAGHLRVDIGTRRPYVHQLVAELFLEPAPGEVCHGDNNPTNNHVSNLRYDTRSANVLDLRATKTHCPAGHEYTDATTYIEPSTGWRRCRVCKKQSRAA